MIRYFSGNKLTGTQSDRLALGNLVLESTTFYETDTGKIFLFTNNAWKQSGGSSSMDGDLDMQGNDILDVGGLAVGKNSVGSGFVLDITGNTRLTGNLNIVGGYISLEHGTIVDVSHIDLGSIGNFSGSNDDPISILPPVQFSREVVFNYGDADEISSNNIVSHITNSSLHRQINDSTTSTTSLWSSQKISNEISNASGGGSSTLAGLTDVSLSNLSNNHSLFYNSSTSQWTNRSPANARSALGLTGDNNTTHYHDTRYYTIAQINTLMDGKADLTGGNVWGGGTQDFVSNTRYFGLGTMIEVYDDLIPTLHFRVKTNESGKQVYASNLEVDGTIHASNFQHSSGDFKFGDGASQAAIIRALHGGGNSDVRLTPFDLEYHQGNNVWKTLTQIISEIDSGGGATELDDLHDTYVYQPQDNQILRYAAEHGFWMNDTLTASLIPNLPASKINSGTFAQARIPTLAKDKISTSGTWAVNDIPLLPISKVDGLQDALDNAGGGGGIDPRPLNNTWTGSNTFNGDVYFDANNIYVSFGLGSLYEISYIETASIGNQMGDPVTVTTPLVLQQGISGDGSGLTGVVADSNLIIKEVSSSTYTLVLQDASRRYLRFSAGATITVPNNSSVAFPVGSIITLRQIGSVDIKVVPGANVVINGFGDSPGRHRSMQLIKVDTNEWDIEGGIEI